MPPESLLEELNHKEPAGISQTKGMEGWGWLGRERESKDAEKMESKVSRQEGMWNISQATKSISWLAGRRRLDR